MVHASLRAIGRNLVLFLGISLVFAFGAKAQDVVVGTIDKVDTGAKTVAVKTADGTVTTVKYTDKTALHGLGDAAHGADLAGKTGGRVIVHDVPEGTDKVARSIVFVGDKTVDKTDGTIFKIGKRTKTVSVKMADNTVKVFTISSHASVNAGKDVFKYSAVTMKEGDHVVVYSTDEAGKSIAHVFEHF
jgi:hypothetical protein